jgi:hypothetical protein
MDSLGAHRPRRVRELIDGEAANWSTFHPLTERLGGNVPIVSIFETGCFSSYD